MKYLKKYNENSKDFHLECKKYIKDLLIELIDYNYYGDVSDFTTMSGDLTHIMVNIFNMEKSYIDISKIKYILLSIIDYLDLKIDFASKYLVVDRVEDGEVGSIYYSIDDMDICPKEILALRLVFKK